MPETKQLLRDTRDRILPPPDVLGGLERRRRHKESMKRAAAAAVGIVVALVGVGGWFLLERESAPRPADPSAEELGIFAPVAGRIVYEDEEIFRGSDPGIWAVDPNGPSDTIEGPTVAGNVASTVVRLDATGATPLGWSSDGTELLLERGVESACELCAASGHLSILHADGSETRLTEEPIQVGGATISPDGSRVVFADVSVDGGLYVVDADGGRPERIAEGGSSPTFSPDGSQIAYFFAPDDGAGDVDEEHVWVADADGGNAHEILADEPTVLLGVSGLQWSPAGDRLALGVGGHEGADALAIYTFAPDGSNFTRVITGGISPHWSPDGTQIAYSILCGEDSDATCPEGSILRSQFDAQPTLFGGGSPGLAIADADGSNVREFGFAASGPWHPETGGPRDDQDVPDLTSDGKDVLDRMSEGEVVNLWPGTTRNRPGLYSWDGPDPAAGVRGRIVGFMHNGYGSGDVEIFLEVVPKGAIPDDGATATTVAGHDGIYKQIDAEREQWIVDIEGTTIAIRLEARPGTSQADLADAYAILGSMRTQPRDNDLGFRLVFALTTNDWDSG
jgi:Tol biopolymer transport system component